MAIFTIRLFFSLLSIYKIQQKSRLWKTTKAYTIYQVDKAITPFSFGKSVYFNKNLYETIEIEKILSHELVHVRQFHTMDNIWAELLVILNWFNPFAWLIRKSIKENLEYIADRQVLNTGINKRDYQYLLLNVSGIHPKGPINSFNLSPLKNRIKMMNKNKTAKVQLLKFLFLLPLIAILLASFRSILPDTKADVQFYGSILNEKTNQPLENVQITDQSNQISAVTDDHGYYAFSINKEADVKYPIQLQIVKDGFKPSTIKIKNLIESDGKLDELYMGNVGLQPASSEQHNVTVVIGAAKGSAQYNSLLKNQKRFIKTTPTDPTTELSGIVFDQTSLAPVADATISNEAKKVLGHTDNKGFYSILINTKSKVDDTYRLTITKPGYNEFLFAFSKKQATTTTSSTHLLTNIGLTKLPLKKGANIATSTSQLQSSQITYEQALDYMQENNKNNLVKNKVLAAHQVIVKMDDQLWIVGKNTTSTYTMPAQLHIMVNNQPMTLDEVNEKFRPQDILSANLKNNQDLFITASK